MILATSTVSIVLYVLLAIFSRKTASTVSEPGVFTAKGVVAHSVAGNNDHNPHDLNGTPRRGHAIYSLVGFASLVTISCLIASRLHLINKYKAMNFIRFLLISIYSTALGMHMSLGVFMSSWDFIGPHLCYTSVILCLAFYIANKALVYIFLIERIHQLREIARRVDFVWSVGVVIILAGFGTIAVFAFLDPVHDLSSIDGKCRIGLRSKATIFLLAYDVGTNIVLTGIFVFQSYKWVEDLPFEAQLKTLTSFIPNALGRLPPTTTVRDFRVQLGHVMMSKSLVGAIAVTIPTLTNLIILYTLGGHERGWLCFTTCTIDVTWSVIVVHWLTSHPAVDLVDNPIGQRASTHLPGGSGEYHEMS